MAALVCWGIVRYLFAILLQEIGNSGEEISVAFRNL